MRQKPPEPKELIGAIVKDYVRVFPQEYALFREGMRKKLADKSNDFSEVKGADYLQREICEWPETLDAMFTTRLPEDALKWFYTKEGTRWFAKSYPQFSAARKL